MKLDNCNTLITGASAGIGRECAQQLASRARTLVLVARREQRLNELRDELRNRNAQLNVHVRVVDLGDKSQIEELVRWLQENKIDKKSCETHTPRGSQLPARNERQQRLPEFVQITPAPPAIALEPAQHDAVQCRGYVFS